MKPARPNWKTMTREEMEERFMRSRERGREETMTESSRTAEPLREDEDFIAAEVRLLIPEGNYAVELERSDKGICYGRKTLFLYWKIVSPAKHSGTVLYQPLNVNLRRFSVSSGYYKAWVVANGGKPVGGEIMSPNVFAGKRFEAEVTTVEDSGYSKVNRLISRIS